MSREVDDVLKGCCDRLLWKVLVVIRNDEIMIDHW